MIRIGSGTYVPLVRWKGAERLALQAVSKYIRPRIVPLIELVPKDFAPLAEAGAIQKFGKQLAETWGWGPKRRSFSTRTCSGTGWELP